MNNESMLKEKTLTKELDERRMKLYAAFLVTAELQAAPGMSQRLAERLLAFEKEDGCRMAETVRYLEDYLAPD